MKYRTFGKNGPEVSEIGFGAWAIGGSWGNQKDSDSLEALEIALDQGLNFIDTAAGYGDSELRIGPWMKNHRQDFFLADRAQAVHRAKVEGSV